MNIELQSTILRVLELGEFLRIGGTKPIKVNVRIISATNKNLPQLMRDKLFREDLFYRLNGIPIIIPPLRERKEDIIPIAEHYLEIVNKRERKNIKISPEAKEALLNYSFPGNVRELVNIIYFSLQIP